MPVLAPCVVAATAAHSPVFHAMDLVCAPVRVNAHSLLAILLTTSLILVSKELDEAASIGLHIEHLSSLHAGIQAHHRAHVLRRLQV